MRKVMILLTAAGAAMAASAPASAQYYPQPHSGYGYNQPYGYPAQYGQPGYGYGQSNWLFNFRDNRYARMMQDRVQRIRYDIRQMAAMRLLSRSEARSLDSDARNLERRIWNASRHGVNPNEARSIDRRIYRLERRVMREANDWNRRAGARRYNPYNYDRYYNQYGSFYRDYDRDGRNDRYEDDRGRDRD
jgi:hypothetical protein